jgi:hypothetical protein
VKYHLTNHPPNTTLKRLASTIKARWSCEQAHQQLTLAGIAHEHHTRGYVWHRGERRAVDAGDERDRGVRSQQERRGPVSGGGWVRAFCI